jgi:hypothetical protein
VWEKEKQTDRERERNNEWVRVETYCCQYALKTISRNIQLIYKYWLNPNEA